MTEHVKMYDWFGCFLGKSKTSLLSRSKCLSDTCTQMAASRMALARGQDLSFEKA